MTKVVLLANAIVKSIAHGAKYPQGRVSGLFLGRLLKSKGDKKHCVVYDAVPVAHTHCIAHIHKIAVLLAEEYCKERKLCIVGYYQADSVLDIKNTEITEEKVPFPKEILELANKDFFFCKLNYSHLSKEILACFEFEGNFELFTTKIARESLERTLETSGYSQLMDIDDHLCNPESDFFNTQLVNREEEEELELEKLDLKL